MRKRDKRQWKEVVIESERQEGDVGRRETRRREGKRKGVGEDTRAWEEQGRKKKDAIEKGE